MKTGPEGGGAGREVSAEQMLAAGGRFSQRPLPGHPDSCFLQPPISCAHLEGCGTRTPCLSPSASRAVCFLHRDAGLRLLSHDLPDGQLDSCNTRTRSQPRSAAAQQKQAAWISHDSLLSSAIFLTRCPHAAWALVFISRRPPMESAALAHDPKAYGC